MKNENFFETLTPDILAPNEYIDWSKINQKIKELRREIALLQSLDKDNPLEDLSDLLSKNPQILKVLQLLIAHTPSKIYFDDVRKYIDFRNDIGLIAANSHRANEVASYFIDMGLIEFLKEVSSLEDVIKGVLIGLEPNARKNRRGSKLETIIYDLLTSTLSKINQNYTCNLTCEPQMYVDLEKERKEVDYLIFKDNSPIAAVEVNFYSTSGSKPSEVLGRAYPEVQTNLEKKKMGLIVITDGVGWENMKPVIATAQIKLKYLMNIKQAEHGALKEAILEITDKVNIFK